MLISYFMNNFKEIAGYSNIIIGCELITWYVCWWLHIGCDFETAEDLENKLNPDMEKVDTWSESNRITTNCDKTKVMLITTYQKQT